MKFNATRWAVVVLGLVVAANSATADEGQDRQGASVPPVAVTPGPAPQPATVAVTVDLPVLSAYVSRGQVLNDEWVFQPGLTVTKGGLAAGVLGSLNLTDRVTDDALLFSEVDLTLSYSHTVGPLGVTGGYVEYLFPNTTLVETAPDGSPENRSAYPGTKELFLTVAVPDWVVVPALSVYQDIGEVEAAYVTARVSWTQALGAKVSVTLGASVGYADENYNAYYFLVEKAGFNDGNLSAALSWQVLDNLTITPSLQFTTLLDGAIKDGAAGLYKDDQSVWGGVKASWGL